MLTLRKYLYLAGPWNANQPFHYDFNDPRGTSIQGAILSHYLSTRKGQCVSMPMLYIALAQAPNHMFVMLKADNGTWLNLETTSDGAPTALASYQRQSPMTPTALDNGSYMRPLSKRETVVVLTELLMQYYLENGQPEQTITLANEVVEIHPTNISLFLYASSAFNAMVKRDYVAIYPTSADIPLDQKARFNNLAGRAFALQKKAFTLGYKINDAETGQAYLERVNQAKNNLGKQEQ